MMNPTVPDSISVAIQVVEPFPREHCHEQDAPSSLREKEMCYVGRIPYAYGIMPETRPMLPGYNSGVMALVIGAFLLIAINFRHYSTFLKTFTQDLFYIRRGSSLFDDHTVSEIRITLSLLVLVCLCEGIIGYFGLVAIGYSGPIFPAIGACTACAMLLYLFQRMSYWMTGFIFADGEATFQWLKGFRASQSALGLALLLPAMWVLFNPGSDYYVLMLSAALYVCARLIFIRKGFRIFYKNLFSLVYFILYLCTLEIVPILLMYRAAVFLK